MCACVWKRGCNVSSDSKPRGETLKQTLPVERGVVITKPEGAPLSFIVATLWLVSSPLTERFPCPGCCVMLLPFRTLWSEPGTCLLSHLWSAEASLEAQAVGLHLPFLNKQYYYKNSSGGGGGRTLSIKMQQRVIVALDKSYFSERRTTLPI